MRVLPLAFTASVATVAIAGCVFDTASVVPDSSTQTNGQVDVQAIDALTLTDTHTLPDALQLDLILMHDGKVADSHTPTDGNTPSDTVQLDTVTPDSVAPDTAPWPDLVPWPDTVGPTSCTAKYGQAWDFVLCNETATSCEFYVKTNEDTCNNLCSSFGGTCLGGYDNSGSIFCTPSGQSSSCDWVHSTQICICSK